MLLSFADLHFGVRSYSNQLSSGFFSAEEDAMIVLDKIFERASQSDIDRVIVPGDITHTNKPTSLVVKFLTNWLYRIDELGKPFDFVPGNHDDSVYAHSIAFISELKLKNVNMIDRALLHNPARLSTAEIPSVRWNDWEIVFAPYFTVSSNSLKDKNEAAYSLVRDCLTLAQKKTIVVAHVQESSAKLGSEQVMISKGVDIINTDNYAKEDIILLTGHIHRHQIYKKGNITVCYPGSPYYMDVTDADQQKGYVLIDTDGSIKFEQIQGIRKFQHYRIAENVNPVEFLKGMRLQKNQVMFFTMPPSSKIYEKELKAYVLSLGNDFGNIYYRSHDIEFNKNIVIHKNDPYQIIRDNIKGLLDGNTEYLNFGLTREDAEERLFTKMVNIYQNKDTAEESTHA